METFLQRVHASVLNSLGQSDPTASKPQSKKEKKKETYYGEVHDLEDPDS